MATGREGNVLKVPGTGAVAETKTTEILGSYARFTQKGLTLEAGQGVLEAGTLLVESGTTPGKYVGLAAATVDFGAAGVVGVLRKGVDTTDEDKLANYVPSGIVKGDAFKAADGTTVTAENAAAALGGRVDGVHGYVIF